MNVQDLPMMYWLICALIYENVNIVVVSILIIYNYNFIATIEGITVTDIIHISKPLNSELLHRKVLTAKMLS
jgi:hypothetical protein